MVVVMKSLQNFSNLKPNDPHTFKEELKIKIGTISAIIRKFPIRTGVLEYLLQVETPSLDWATYCAIDAGDQLIWEEKADAFNKAMLLLMNSKNNNAKKDLHLVYSQGNKIAYPLDVESMTRYLLSMYNIKSVNNPRDKRGIRTKRKMMDPNLKIRITTTQTPWVHTAGKIQRPKIQTLLVMDLALAHTYLKSTSLILGRHYLFKQFWPHMPLTIPSGTIPMYVMNFLILEIAQKL